MKNSHLPFTHKNKAFSQSKAQTKPVMLQELFERTADARPQSIALISGEREYTYSELESYANRIAFHLRAKGVQAGDRVGILLKRSVETYATIIAVLKLGAAYVPLDFSPSRSEDWRVIAVGRGHRIGIDRGPRSSAASLRWRQLADESGFTGISNSKASSSKT